MPRESRSRSSVVGFCTYHPESAYRSRMHGEVAVLAHHVCSTVGMRLISMQASTGHDLMCSKKAAVISTCAYLCTAGIVQDAQNVRFPLAQQSRPHFQAKNDLEYLFAPDLRKQYLKGLEAHERFVSRSLHIFKFASECSFATT